MDPQAYIYAPARTASQQGQSKTATLKSKGPAWKIDFEVQQKYATAMYIITSCSYCSMCSC